MTAQLNARGDVAVLVPAAGAGVRLGPGGPKALRLLAGEPLLVHAIRRVAAAPSVRLIVVAAPAAEVEAVRALLAPVAPVTVVAGGAERQESVALALAAVPADIDIVLVHDAARALTPPRLFESVAAAVRERPPAVIPVLPVVDTIKEVGPGEAVLGTVDRSVCAACRRRRVSGTTCWRRRTRPPPTRSPTTPGWWKRPAFRWSACPVRSSR